MPSSRIRQLLKFAKVFGLLAGTRLWISLFWQSILRRDTLKLCVPGIASPIYLRGSDLPIFWQILIMRENCFDAFPQSVHVRRDYDRLAAKGCAPVILDCGGHIGLSAVWFATNFPKAIICTVEPNAENFVLLKKNTCAYSNIFSVNGGIWSRSCWLTILNPESGSASYRVKESGRQGDSDHPADLRAYTIDEILLKTPGSRLLLAKIDIEGAESELFKSASALTFSSMLIIELHDWLMPGLGTSRSFFKWLAQNDFDVVLQGENLLLFHNRSSTFSVWPPSPTSSAETGESVSVSDFC